MGNPSSGKKLEPDKLCEECETILIDDEKEIGLCQDCQLVDPSDGSSNIMGGDTGVDADDPYLFKVENEKEERDEEN